MPHFCSADAWTLAVHLAVNGLWIHHKKSSNMVLKSSRCTIAKDTADAAAAATSNSVDDLWQELQCTQHVVHTTDTGSRMFTATQSLLSLLLAFACNAAGAIVQGPWKQQLLLQCGWLACQWYAVPELPWSLTTSFDEP